MRPLFFAIAVLACAQLSVFAEGQTYALLVGVSEYEKLPHDLWLQYPDADARSFAEFLASPRGGSIPASQMVLLTNAQATSGAVRKAFSGFLKERPGSNDTVYVLIASHGTVDSKGSYILTWDSDPENLDGTAIGMGELRDVVERELKTAGRVIFLADVCRAAAIAGQKSTAIGGAVEKLAEAPGEMLGLMAARPRELSMEGPQFGGGHGAFTYSVLKGLSGAADVNGDGSVTAGELIDFVTADVAKRTDNRQHPRDFGSMGGSTRLSDLSKPGPPHLLD